MPLDPTISLQVRPPQIESPVNAMAKVLQIKEAQQGQEMNRLKMDEYRSGVERTNRLNQLLQSGADAQGLRRGGFLKESMDLEKAEDERLKGRASAGKDRVETAGKKVSFYKDQMFNVNDPQTAAQLITAMHSDPDLQPLGMDKVPLEKMLAQIPQDPAQFGEFKAKYALGADKFMADLRAKAQQAETGRHNLATEKNAAGQLAVSQGNLGVSRQNLQLRGQELELNRNQPRGQIIETESGPMLADPRAGTARPVIGPDGKPLGRKLKDAPPAIQNAALSNSQNLARAERALKLVEGVDIGDPTKGGQKGDKSATGLKGYLPNQLLNRMDPQGVDARAAIADLGSLVIHDRSGAAVTAAEFPRLAPFIPTEKDDAATVKKKLQRFVQVYKEENSAFQTAYNPNTGYRAPGGAAAPAADAGKTVKRTGTLNGRKVVEYSDGTVSYVD